MKKFLICVLILLLLVGTVSAEAPYVQDDAGLMNQHEAAFLEESYRQIQQQYGFTPILVTVDSFGGLSAEEFAGSFYDAHAYGDDGLLLLVSLEEGQWYILTNGLCAEWISDNDVQTIGEEVAELIRDQRYYEAFQHFAQLGGEYMAVEQEEWVSPEVPQTAQPQSAPFGKTAAICMAVGMGIGLVVVGIMAARMKSVRQQNSAADYVRPGSFQLTHSRDLYLYSTVHRTPRPKNNSSSGAGRSGGVSRGGGGGRL